MTSHELKGRRVLVTGAARGLGAGIAGAMARAGADMMVADLLEEEGRTTVDTLRKAGARAAFVKLDVTSEADWERGIARRCRTWRMPPCSSPRTPRGSSRASACR